MINFDENFQDWAFQVYGCFDPIMKKSLRPNNKGMDTYDSYRGPCNISDVATLNMLTNQADLISFFNIFHFRFRIFKEGTSGMKFAWFLMIWSEYLLYPIELSRPIIIAIVAISLSIVCFLTLMLVDYFCNSNKKDNQSIIEIVETG